MSSVDPRKLECADENPKVVRRIISFVSQSYLVDICEYHKDRPEFQGEEIKKENLQGNAVNKFIIKKEPL